MSYLAGMAQAPFQITNINVSMQDLERSNQNVSSYHKKREYKHIQQHHNHFFGTPEGLATEARADV